MEYWFGALSGVKPKLIVGTTSFAKTKSAFTCNPDEISSRDEEISVYTG